MYISVKETVAYLVFAGDGPYFLIYLMKKCKILYKYMPLFKMVRYVGSNTADSDRCYQLPVKPVALVQENKQAWQALSLSWSLPQYLLPKAGTP